MENKLLAADDKGQHRVEEQGEQCSQHRAQHGDLRSREQIFLLENGGKVIQRPHTGPDMDAAPQGVRAVIEGDGQGIQHRVQGNHHKQDHDDGIEHGKNLVAGSGFNFSCSCSVRHNQSPPF